MIGSATIEPTREGVPAVAELAEVVLSPLAGLAAGPAGWPPSHLLTRVVSPGRRLAEGLAFAAMARALLRGPGLVPEPGRT